MVLRLCAYGAILGRRPVRVATSPNATFTSIPDIKYLMDIEELRIHVVVGCYLLYSKFPAPSATPRRSVVRLTLVNLTLSLQLDGFKRERMHRTSSERFKIKQISPSSTDVTSNVYTAGRVIGGFMSTRLRLRRRSATHKLG